MCSFGVEAFHNIALHPVLYLFLLRVKIVLCHSEEMQRKSKDLGWSEMSDETQQRTSFLPCRIKGIPSRVGGVYPLLASILNKHQNLFDFPCQS